MPRRSAYAAIGLALLLVLLAVAPAGAAPRAAPPSPPTPTSPACGATVPFCAALALTWSDMGASATYDVQVSANIGFTSIVHHAEGCADWHHTIPAGVLSVLSTNYYWRVRAWMGGEESAWCSPGAVWTVCDPPATPVLASPADGATHQCSGVTFTWSAVPYATGYDIEIVGGGGIYHVDTPEYSQPYMTPGIYTWRVRAINDCGLGDWSASRTLRIEFLGPSLTAPANGASLPATKSVHLQWTTGGAIFVDSSYLQVARDAAFVQIVIEDYVLEDDPDPLGYTIAARRLSPGTYYWHVQTGSGPCGISHWSATRSLVLYGVPAQPALAGPADGAVFARDESIKLDWDTLSNVTSYRVQVDDDPDFASPVVDATSEISEYTLTGEALFSSASAGVLAATWDFNWRVSAGNAAGQGPWSAVRLLRVTGGYCVMLPLALTP